MWERVSGQGVGPATPRWEVTKQGCPAIDTVMSDLTVGRCEIGTYIHTVPYYM